MKKFPDSANAAGKRSVLREKLWNEAEVHAQVVAGQETAGEKFADR